VPPCMGRSRGPARLARPALRPGWRAWRRPVIWMSRWARPRRAHRRWGGWGAGRFLRAGPRLGHGVRPVSVLVPGLTFRCEMPRRIRFPAGGRLPCLHVATHWWPWTPPQAVRDSSHCSSAPEGSTPDFIAMKTGVRRRGALSGISHPIAGASHGVGLAALRPLRQTPVTPWAHSRGRRGPPPDGLRGDDQNVR
jgi:hypothetical protein